MNMEMLDKVVAIAKEAGSRIMKIYASEIEVEIKADNSPLTAADRASHEHIVASLEQWLPEIPVVSEESAALPWETRRAWEDYWLIDPLDGTKEFIKRNGEFTVNIARIRNGVPVLGVVYAPDRDVCWFAAKGLGAYRQSGSEQPIRIEAASPKNYSGLKVVGSRSHQSEAIKSFLSRLDDPTLVPMGSSIKLCAVADGSADIYPRLGLTSEWDTAAAHSVVLESGGSVVNPTGAPLPYNSKDSLLNSYFLVLGNVNDQWRDEIVDWFGEAAEIG